ncbi:hypothetical protein PMAYCL1PPCAC_16473, partial [Pristionchus mayeri]
MSAKTREMHQYLIKVLSIHAVLPSFLIFGFILMFLQMTNYYHSVQVETLEYTIVVFPAVVNTVLTLYYVEPYR